MRTSYRCRAYPDEAQQQVLARTFGCVRVVWNRTLAARRARWQAQRKGTSYADSDRALTAMKTESGLAFLNEVSSVPLQQAVRHQHAACQAFFAGRSRYPRFKSRHGRQSATYTRSAFRMRAGKLRLAKTATPLRYVRTWPDIDVDGLDPTSVTVARDPAGRWFVTFHVEVPGPAPLPAAGRNVGVDVGLIHFAVLSPGEKIEHPKDWERHERRLKRYLRRLSRCQKGSANRAKATMKVARVHARIADARRDFLHKASTRLIRTADVIAFEDLNVAGMVRNRKLARAISCSGWAGFRSMLEYKAERCGRKAIIVDRWYPSSKTCSTCGLLLASLSLGTRHWTCPACGTRHDRDINAAKNILAAGLAADACGADVRHGGVTSVQSAVKQELLARAQESRSIRAGRNVKLLNDAASAGPTTSCGLAFQPMEDDREPPARGKRPPQGEPVIDRALTLLSAFAAAEESPGLAPQNSTTRSSAITSARRTRRAASSSAGENRLPRAATGLPGIIDTSRRNIAVPALSDKTLRRPRERCPAVSVFVIFPASGGLDRHPQPRRHQDPPQPRPAAPRRVSRDRRS